MINSKFGGALGPLAHSRHLTVHILVSEFSEFFFLRFMALYSLNDASGFECLVHNKLGSEGFVESPPVRWGNHLHKLDDLCC